MGACALALWFGHIALFLQYTGTRPKAPRPESGQIYSINNHGTVVYLNYSETMYLRLLAGSAVAIFIGGVVLDRFAAKSIRPTIPKIR